MENWEYEIVEFKTASGQFSAEKIGQYFSAISNEANLKNQQYGWLVLGYDLSKGNQVTVTIYGKILDEKYTNLLYANHDLNIETVFLLDQVQKRVIITKADADRLREQGLIEGRYPNIYVSYKIAEAIGDQATYIKNRGIDDEVCVQLIISALKHGPAKKKDLYDSLQNALPGLTPEKKSKKIANLIQKMRRNGTIDNQGKTLGAEWFLK